MLRIASPFLKLLAKLLLLVYFAAGGLFLGVRYWLLPNVDQWRPQIAQQLSSALNVTVNLGHISADWSGLRPRLAMSDVTLIDKRQRKVLDLPHVRAELSWRSVATLTLQFSRIDASGVDVSVRRDRFERFWVMGQSFEPSVPEQLDSGVYDEVMGWLATQRQVVLRDSTLRWLDETRTRIPLVFRDMTLVLQNRGSDHRFSLSAAPPSELGRSLDLRGEFRQLTAAQGQAFSLRNSVGTLYAHIDRMSPLGWSTWIDTPRQLLSGEVTAKGWLELNAGTMGRYTLDMAAWNGRWTLDELPDGGHVAAEFLHLYLAGGWNGFQDVFPSLLDLEMAGRPLIGATGSAAPIAPVEIRLAAKGLEFQAPTLFGRTLRFDMLDAKGSAKRSPDSTLQLDVERVNLSNRDMQASLAGSWREGGSSPAGQIDAYGRFRHALIASIDDYLPNTVSVEARDWMATGLLDGQIDNATLTLNGDLAHFPFAQDPSKGNFRVVGEFSGGVIDYLPADDKSPGWPRISDMRGRASLNRADLRLVTDRALMHPDSGLPIQLSTVFAHIPNIEEKPVLTVQGTTRGDSKAYLALITRSPLGEMLDGVLNTATAEGEWVVPLGLNIPLLHSRDTTVRGAIRFSGGSVRLSPAMPPFTQLAGTLDFSDAGLSAKGLKGRFLGGPVSLSGEAGKDASTGLQMQGQVGADALAGFVGMQGMKRLKGTVPYTAVFHHARTQKLSFTINSDLSGLALDLPPPLGKTAAQSMPLRIDWGEHTDGKLVAMKIAVGNTIHATLLHDRKQVAGPYFSSAALGVNQDAVLSGAGANVDIRYPSVNVDAWDRVITEFATPLPETKKGQNYRLLPELRQLRLQTGRAQALGLVFDELTFTARRPATAQWRVDISSSQTAGTLFWREAHQRIAGHIDAKFDRLALGSQKKAGADGKAPDDQSYEVSDQLDIPGVNLYVKNLRLYGRDAGELTVVGVNQARGQLWRLDQLKVTGPGGLLTGAGTWRLSGKDRGLTLDAEATFSNLGEYLEHAGFKDLMRGGAGKVVGRLEWHNMPWDVSRADLNGKVEIDLQNGRFSSVNSRSSRLLELLSLQSLQRLARMDINPAGLAKDGFPYDRLRGTLLLNSGVMSTDDYRVVGPVGTIVLAGDINLISERLDLEAVVVPNLDVSGAAIAAGIAINPIVGIGAFLTQWLLKTPLAKAMTAQYHIDGDWDDPKISDTVVPAASKVKESSPITP
ncbi:YhdP family protein [Pollutimonas nitritireducens]|uniref:YhdP family protein n=1 Tax=Pollutimonas nitritireducens TaxID=2045209 RepID=UPI0011809848|nr:YhdP family protein [Pollutimonas nitritireducens]